MTIYNKNNLK